MDDHLTSENIGNQITRLTDKRNAYFGLANFYSQKTYQSLPRRKNVSKKLKRDPKAQHHYRTGLKYRNAVTRITKKIENLLELKEALLSPLENNKTQPTHSELVSSVSKFIEDTDQSLQNYNEASLKKNEGRAYTEVSNSSPKETKDWLDLVVIIVVKQLHLYRRSTYFFFF
ncbi:hypothetical protein QM565_23665 [Geitlerinema splendidum]|nr:hypothetical protein [Geitlerinema splendidum]